MRRRADLDVTRVLCMAAVVYLHCASSAFYDLSNRPLFSFSCWVNALAVLAVPLFFMMSGALTLSPGADADPRRVPRRRVGKVLLPLAAWSGVYLLYLWRVRGDGAGALAGLRSILGTPANVSYWFLYALIPIYLLLPLLRPMVDGLDRARWRYLLALWLGLTLGLPTLRAFLPAGEQVLLTPHPSLNLDAVGGYLGYFLLGAYLDRLERLPSRPVLVWGAVLATLLAGGLSQADSLAQGAWSGRFTDYLTVFTALRAAGMFLLLKSLLGGRETRSRAVRALAGCSFCVYLVHPLVVMAGQALWFRATGLYDLATIPQQLVFFLAVLAVCVGIALVLASIPGLCRLFTGQSFSAACRNGNLIALFRPKNGEKGTNAP